MPKKARLPKYSDKWTRKQLNELEDTIQATYQQAYTEVKHKTDTYLSKLIPRLIEQYESGEYTDEQWRAYLQAQIGRGQRWNALKNTCAERMTKANEVAQAYINDTTPKVYSLNANYEAYMIEQLHPNISFTLVDEQTVKNLMRSNWAVTKPPMLTLNAASDAAYNAAVFQNALTQAIIQGESVEKLAKRLPAYKKGMEEAAAIKAELVKEGFADMSKAVAGDVAHKARTAALRQARTALTGAQNAGRIATYEKAADMGIIVMKRWLCTLDDRTRDTHQDVDGERVPYDQPFSNGLMYPGDTSGEPSEWWNCRCTLVTDDAAAVSMGDRRARTEDGRSYTVQYMTYKEWEAAKNG